ncbi:hypothetical protein [Chelativorans sp. AA-79]|uniref:hypothetical protein n=1 Tax=Chelativorans sp. AA-79 TaxID=3028735 RepID=UPI0023F7E057|nr:hypothetical protein [Chelativorans sp. AA-79]WEX09697.1 hypothetical protein PVE73_01615 [Chelativorans sp. AA-79]
MFGLTQSLLDILAAHPPSLIDCRFPQLFDDAFARARKIDQAEPVAISFQNTYVYVSAALRHDSPIAVQNLLELLLFRTGRDGILGHGGRVCHGEGYDTE